MEDIVILKNITFSYDAGATFVLDEVYLEVSAGEHVVLIGKNGSGKSTLAKIAAGLIAPDAGSVKLFGQVCFNEDGADSGAYESARRKIAYVFQDPTCSIVAQNVASNIAFAPQNLGFSVEAIDEVVATELDKAGLGRLAEKDPNALSGGEQQLVAIASAIAAKPEFLVLDEPTAFLDDRNSKNCMRLVEKLSKQCAILHITHKTNEIKMADRVVKL